MSEQQSQPQQQPEVEIDAGQIDAAVASVRHALGYELSEDDMAEVRNGVERQLKQAARMRAYPLQNADEPDFVFQAYRAEG
ncbi:MAG TPA: hypothetical protein VMM78_05000 [Thermomicrobiales bacterium]|nr:hypothetical protein [Thermomicrobiales bacterium]